MGKILMSEGTRPRVRGDFIMISYYGQLVIDVSKCPSVLFLIVFSKRFSFDVTSLHVAM